MKKEILLLQQAMKEYAIDAYVVPTCDFHGSEYLQDYFKTRKFLSGFTGSAGTLVVTKDEACLWTDGRYFLQGRMELLGSEIKLMESGMPGVPSISEYLASEMSQGQTIGFDGRVMTCESGIEFEKLSGEYHLNISFDLDLISDFWTDRPPLVTNKVWELPASCCGRTFPEKLSDVRASMNAIGASHFLICSLEESAWLLNLRGSDAEGTPVFMCFTLIGPDSVTLYASTDAFSDTDLPDGVTLKSYLDGKVLTVNEDLKLLSPDAKILVDASACSYYTWKLLEAKHTISAESPIIMMKAVKNATEIACARSAHIDDGAALVRFIYWLKRNIDTIPLSEITAADYLESMRRKVSDFVDLSFDTIAGYGPNGAIIHYYPTEETNAALKPEGFLLVDSGAQYMRTTTDVTRTIALGPLTEKMKKCYTAVLKSNLNLAMAKFNKHTTCIELDSITRRPVNEIGFDYNHGTGHGVGHVLSVHEGPNTLNKRNNRCTIVPGTITTDEPGIYIEGEFGIRLENELLCVPCDSDNNTYCFEPLTLCPFDRSAIIKEMLTDTELKFLNNYHKKVYDTLSPLLDESTREFLLNETAAL